MGKKARCPECGAEFEMHLPKHRYCGRRCYKRFARRKKRLEMLNGRPSFLCGCGTRSELDFAPLVEWRKWQDWGCPKCGWRPMGQPGSRELPPE